MVMTAPPGDMLNDFEVLRPISRVYSLQRKLFEMTKNECSAWSVYRPSSSAVPDNQIPLHDGIDSIGSISNQCICNGDVSNASSVSQVSHIDRWKFSHGIPVGESQNQPLVRALDFQHGDTDMSRFESPRPILRGNHPWSIAGREGVFPAEHLEEANRFKECRYQSAKNSDPGILLPNPYAQIADESSRIEASASKGRLNLDRNRSFKTCTDSSSSNLSIDPRALVSSDPLTWYEAMDKRNWWPPSACHDGVQRVDDLIPYDGLPWPEQHQLYDDAWITGSRTTSPIVLAFESPPPAMSTSISSEDTLDFLSRTSINCDAKEERRHRSRSETAANREERTYNSTGNCEQPKLVPAAFRMSRNTLSNPPSRKSPVKRSTKNRSLKPSPGGKSYHKPPIYESYNSSSLAVNVQNQSPPARLNTTEADALKLLKRNTQDNRANSTQFAMTDRSDPQRNTKDDFLVRSKLAGMSYKDIRRHGKFSEAESTLRGRFRTLTKHKTARVRKPEWEENDVQLLVKAVRRLTRGSEPATSRVPWKQVAEYIADNGGSYHFGNATCRKKWDELEKGTTR